MSNVYDEIGSLDGIDRRSYLQATGAAALGTVGLAGCVGRAVGTLATSVTDQPADIGDFESLVVTIEGIWLGPEGAISGADDDQAMDDGDEEDDGDADEDDGDADDEGETDAGNGDDSDEDEDDEDGENDASGREYYEFDEPQEADLVQLQGEETQLIDERELSVASYQFLQLNISNVEGVLEDGSETTVDRPGNAPLTFNQAFEIQENTRTSFTADFAPVRRGTGSYLLRPVPRGIEVVYGDDESADEDDGSGDEDDGSGDRNDESVDEDN